MASRRFTTGWPQRAPPLVRLLFRSYDRRHSPRLSHESVGRTGRGVAQGRGRGGAGADVAAQRCADRHLDCVRLQSVEKPKNSISDLGHLATGSHHRKAAEPVILNRQELRGTTDVPGQPVALRAMVSLPQACVDDRGWRTQPNGPHGCANRRFEASEVLGILNGPRQHEQACTSGLVVPRDRPEVGEDQPRTERVAHRSRPKTRQFVDVEERGRGPSLGGPLSEGMTDRRLANSNCSGHHHHAHGPSLAARPTATSRPLDCHRIGGCQARFCCEVPLMS